MLDASIENFIFEEEKIFLNAKIHESDFTIFLGSTCLSVLPSKKIFMGAIIMNDKRIVWYPSFHELVLARLVHKGENKASPKALQFASIESANPFCLGYFFEI
ncbi:hypothetical protein [Floricoccus penangensis]|uniref:hypothetical protein n=1 Tax=Floricoccus penangensis TaxID=1859475 RepID=UPI0020420192|nr:hypothetical protein [Floricoccus penangensis]URZ88107.1 hypothetical protein KIW23_03490 [Floricoccus penangensis]